MTGRTARTLTKRIPQFTGQSADSNQASTSVLQRLKHTEPSKSQIVVNASALQPPEDQLAPIIRPNHILSSAEILAPTPESFWDNRSILCVKDRRYDEEKEIKFNPALDAASALGIATCIVLSSALMAVKVLSNKWDLENWEDWRMFIQGGYLGPLIIPKGWKDSASAWVPESFRLPVSTSEETDPDIDPNNWEWKRTLDHEWKQEMARREEERKEWVSRRQSAHKKIW